MSHVDPSQQSPPAAPKSPGVSRTSNKTPDKNTNLALILVVVIAVVAGFSFFRLTSEDNATTNDLHAAAELDSGAEEPSAAEPASVERSLLVTANVRGASVFLNDRRVGKTPHRATPLDPGQYRVRVEQVGYRSVEEQVKVTGEETTLSVILEKVPSSVTAAAPTEDAGESAASTSSSDAIVVKHKHRFGLRSCQGVLRVASGRLRYETDHKDAFAIPLSEIEDWELHKKTLKFKIRDGKSYSFNEVSGDLDALASFHENVVRVGRLNY